MTLSPSAAFGRAAHVVRLETWVQRVTGVPMEPRVAVGVWDPASGRYTVHAGAGGLGRTQAGVAGALGVPERAVRVMARDVGGNFGTRNNCYPEFAPVAWAARRVGRPVKWTSERREAFLADYHGRDLGARRAGAGCRGQLPRDSRCEHQQRRRARRLAPPAQQGHGADGHWVKLPAETLAALRAHLEAMDLESSVNRWSPEQRELASPTPSTGSPRYGAFFELVWKPLLTAAKLPYRKPHAMRPSYATWMLEAGADLRWVKDQLGHASIEETEGTYGHLEWERHEGRVNLDAVLGGVHSRPLASTLPDEWGE